MYASVHGTGLSSLVLLLMVIYLSSGLTAVMVKVPYEESADIEYKEPKYDDESSMLELVYRVHTAVTTRRPLLDTSWLVMAPRDQGNKMFISTHEKPYIFVKK